MLQEMQVFATWLGAAGDAGGEEGGSLKLLTVLADSALTVSGWDSFFLLAIFERSRAPWWGIRL